MAVIIVSGFPCSGRSTATAELVADFERRIASSSSAPVARVQVVSDASVHNAKSCYSSQLTEKPARASYLSAVTRAIAKDCITVADGGAGLNIKGFRYQVWCNAREEGVRCVSLQVHAPPEVCKERNRLRREKGEESYEDETIEEMLLRYEEPNEMVRWDQPLFVVSSVLVSLGRDENGEEQKKVDPLPLESIWNAAVEGVVNKAPGVVKAQRSTAGSYLTMLETATQAVVSSLLTHQQSFGLPEGGGTVKLSVSLSSGPPLAMTLNLPATSKPINLAILQRQRRAFVKMHASSNASVNALGEAARSEAKDASGGEAVIAKRFGSWLCESL